CGINRAWSRTRAALGGVQGGVVARSSRPALAWVAGRDDGTTGRPGVGVPGERGGEGGPLGAGAVVTPARGPRLGVGAVGPGGAAGGGRPGAAGGGGGGRGGGGGGGGGRRGGGGAGRAAGGGGGGGGSVVLGGAGQRRGSSWGRFGLRPSPLDSPRKRRPIHG